MPDGTHRGQRGETFTLGVSGSTRFEHSPWLARDGQKSVVLGLEVVDIYHQECSCQHRLQHGHWQITQQPAIQLLQIQSQKAIIYIEHIIASLQDYCHRQENAHCCQCKSLFFCPMACEKIWRLRLCTETCKQC